MEVTQLERYPIHVIFCDILNESPRGHRKRPQLVSQHNLRRTMFNMDTNSQHIIRTRPEATSVTR